MKSPQLYLRITLCSTKGGVQTRLVSYKMDAGAGTQYRPVGYTEPKSLCGGIPSRSIYMYKERG